MNNCEHPNVILQPIELTKNGDTISFGNLHEDGVCKDCDTRLSINTLTTTQRQNALVMIPKDLVNEDGDVKKQMPPL